MNQKQYDKIAYAVENGDMKEFKKLSETDKEYFREHFEDWEATHCVCAEARKDGARMNDCQLVNVQVAKNYVNSAVSRLDEFCRNCESKEKCDGEIRCNIGQARMRIAVTSRLLSEIIDQRKESVK